MKERGGEGGSNRRRGNRHNDRQWRKKVRPESGGRGRRKIRNHTAQRRKEKKRKEKKRKEEKKRGEGSDAGSEGVKEIKRTMLTIF